MIDMDITQLLEDYVLLLEKGGISRESTESKLMLEASKEIKRLRSSLEFQIKLADDNNNSRLRLLDVIINCMNLYGETCKKIREKYVDNSVCGMCIEGRDCGLDGCTECSGVEKDDCFRLNVNKFNDIVFKKEKNND